jgi:hypothetical protein
MANEQEIVEVLVTARPDGVEETTAKTDALGASVERVTQRVDQKSGSLEKLARQYDTLYGLEQRYNDLQEKVQGAYERAIAAGIDEAKALDQRQRALAGIDQQYMNSISAAEKATLATGELTKAHGHLAGSSTAVREGLVLVHEFLSGNYHRAMGSATIEIQALAGGASNLLTIITNPLVLAGAGAAATLIAMSVAAVQAHHSLEAVSQALLISGGAAGVTTGQMEVLAQKISNSSELSAKDVRALEAQFISTGKVTGDQLTGMIDLAGKYAKATGEDLGKAGEALVKLVEDPQKGIADWDAKLNVLTASQLRMVQGFLSVGQAKDALNVFFDALDKRVEETVPKLTWLGQTMQSIGHGIASWWDQTGKSVSGLFVTPNNADQIAALQAKLNDHSADNRGGMGGDAWRQQIQDQIDKLKEMERQAQATAKAKADALAAQTVQKTLDTTLDGVEQQRLDIENLASVPKELQPAYEAAWKAYDANISKTHDATRAQQVFASVLDANSAKLKLNAEAARDALAGDNDQLANLQRLVAAQNRGDDAFAAEQRRQAAEAAANQFKDQYKKDARAAAVSTDGTISDTTIAKINADADAKASQVEKLTRQMLDAKVASKDYEGELLALGDQLDRLADKGGAAGDVVGHQWDGAIRIATKSLEELTDHHAVADDAVDNLREKLEAQAKALTAGSDVIANQMNPDIKAMSEFLITHSKNADDARQFIEKLTKAIRDQTDAAQEAQDQATEEAQGQLDKIKRLQDEAVATAAGTDALKKYKDAISLQDATDDFETQLDKINKKLTDPTAEQAILDWHAKLAAGVKLTPEEIQAAVDSYHAAFAQQQTVAQTAADKLAADKPLEKIFDNAGKEIQNTLAGAFTSVFDGATKKGYDFGQTLLDTMKKIAGQIAAALIFQPVIGGITSSLGLGSLFGNSNASASGSGSSGASGSSSLGLFDLFKSAGSILSSPGTLFGTAQAGINAFGAANLGLGSGLTSVAGTTLPTGTGILAGSGGASIAGVNAGAAGASLSDLLGTAGIGALGGGIAQILGIAKNGYGGLIGGAAGLALASGPGAALLASLGATGYGAPIALAIGLISSLFGPGKHADAGQSNIVLGSDGQLTQGNTAVGATYTQADRDQLQSSTTQLITGLNAFVNQYGLKFEGTSNRDFNAYIGLGADAGGAHNEQELVKMLLSGQTFTSGAGAQGTLRFASDDPVVQQILKGSKANTTGTLSDLETDLQFAATYKQIEDLAKGTTDYGKQASALSQTMDSLSKFFADATTHAQALGLSIDDFATAEQKAKDAVGSGYIQSIQDQLDQLNGKGFLKSLRDFETQANGQFGDLQALFDKGYITQGQFDAAKITASALQAKEAAGVLVGLTADQIDTVIETFKDDTTVFGQAVEAAAKAIKAGVNIATGVDGATFDATKASLNDRRLAALSILDPTQKAANDNILLQEKRTAELTAALKGLDDAQAKQVRAIYENVYALEDQATAAQKAQTAMANAVTTVQNFGTTVNDYINKSSVDQYSGKSPAEVLQATKDQFAQQYALAQGGNADALNSITTYAQQYRQAISTYYGGGAQGSAASQAVLDQLSALVKTPNLAQSVANNTLRNQGDAGIYIGPDGSIYNNGQRIGFSQNPNAGTNIAGFDALASTWHNDISPDDYKRLAGSRDQLLRGYTDSQLQAVSDKYYGGATVTGLQDFIAKLDGLDANFLSNTDGGAGYGGKGKTQVAGQSGAIDPVAKAVNDNALSIITSTDGIAKAVLALQGLLHGDLNDGGYGVAAYAHVAKDQLTNALIGKGGVTDTQWQIANTYFPILHNDLTATVGPALATIPALVQTIQAMVGQVASLQGQVNSLMAQLTQAQQAAADQASANAQVIVAETKKQTAVIDRQGLQAGGRG